MSINTSPRFGSYFKIRGWDAASKISSTPTLKGEQNGPFLWCHVDDAYDSRVRDAVEPHNIEIEAASDSFETWAAFRDADPEYQQRAWLNDLF